MFPGLCNGTAGMIRPFLGPVEGAGFLAAAAAKLVGLTGAVSCSIVFEDSAAVGALVGPEFVVGVLVLLVVLASAADFSTGAV